MLKHSYEIICWCITNFLSLCYLIYNYQKLLLISFPSILNPLLQDIYLIEKSSFEESKNFFNYWVELQTGRLNYLCLGILL